MNAIIKNLSAKNLTELEKFEAESIAKANKEAAFQKEHNWVMENMCFDEAVKAWKKAGCNGAEPNRIEYNGSWQKLLQTAQDKKNAEIIAFVKEVQEGAKKIKIY